MVYVQRDAAGRLLRVEHEPFEGMTENLAVESEELHSWLEAKEEVKARLDSLKQSDLELVRVLEDVVSVPSPVPKSRGSAACLATTSTIWFRTPPL